MPPTLPECHGKLRSEEILKSKAILILIAAALTVPTSDAMASDLPSGAAVRIVDADTIAVDGLPNIRLYGIDAPEYGQSCIDGRHARYDCGKVATAALARLFDRGDVWCEFERTGRGTVRHDLYGRILAVCGAGKIEANDHLVRNGFAWSYRKMKPYRAAQSEAKAKALGVWAGSNVTPWDWRKAAK